MSFRYLLLSVIPFFVLAFSAAGGTPGLQGIVKDGSGRPIKGAQVRIEAKNGSGFSRIVRTDAAGRYASDNMAVGAYKVTLIVNGAVKASLLNTTTQASKPTELNFELRPASRSGKKHMVWVPGETGTHIGGRWVEVDENGRPVGDAGANNMDRISGGNALRTGVGMPGGGQ